MSSASEKAEVSILVHHWALVINSKQSAIVGLWLEVASSALDYSILRFISISGNPDIPLNSIQHRVIVWLIVYLQIRH